MKQSRARAYAWAVSAALAIYMLWPALGAAATLDEAAFLPVVRVLQRYGLTLPTNFPVPAELAPLLEWARARAAEAGITLPEIPVEEPAETPAGETTPPTPGAITEELPPAPISDREGWLEPWTYDLQDGYAADLPLRISNRALFSNVSPLPWVGDWRTLAEEARGTHASGGLPAVNRQLQREAYKSYHEQKEFYEWEQEQGLIPDVEFGHESDIKFEGRKLFTAGYSHTAYPGGETPGYERPSDDINMEGELQLRIEGTVLRKTHVYVDYDDTRENDSRNQVSVVYKGDPDELVQEAAFGDIVLSLPSTEFVSYSSSRAVFGAKVDLKYKWAELMAIASREKGETETASFTGGTELSSLTVDDTNYTKLRFFLLNTAHDAGGNDFFKTHKIYQDELGQPKIEVFVFPKVQGRWPKGTTRYSLIAREFNDAGAVPSGGAETAVPGSRVYIGKGAGYCRRLSRGTDYTVNAEEGVLKLNTAISAKNDKIAVAYIIASKSSNQIQYRIGYNTQNKLDYVERNIGGNTVYEFGSELKCIRNAEDGKELQRYEQRNYYNLGSNSIRKSTLVVKLLDTNRNERGPDGRTWLQIYGLDERGDGIDDKYVDETYGYLIVPDLAEVGGTWQRRDRNGDGYYDNLPFDYDNNGYVDLHDGIDGDPYLPADKPLVHKLYFYFEYQSLKPSYYLQANIIPGSETVRLNGETLIPSVDYWLDYDSGYLTLRTEAAEDPNAVLEVTYEYKPLFALLTKSLVGGRFQFGPDDDRYLGTTYLAEFSSKPPKGEIPQLEEAPANEQIWDVDARYRIFPKFMTAIADAVPGAHTADESTFELQAEYANSYKNVNTVGAAFVDDMENARTLNNISLKDVNWRPSSPPAVGDYTQANRGNQLLAVHTVTGYLFNQVDPNWPEDQLEIMQVTILPNRPNQPSGGYRWGGIHRVLSPEGVDFQGGRYDYCEFLLNLNNSPLDSIPDNDIKSGILHLELGSMDERADGSSAQYLARTEDQDGDGRLGPNEDTGIWFDNTHTSPNGRINIRYGAGNQILDTEDDNRNLDLDEANDYYTYAIDLAEVHGENSPYVVRSPGSGLEAGWYIIRIPLDFDKAEKVGSPDPTSIVSLRLWIEAQEDDDFPRPPGKPMASLWFGNFSFSAMRWEPPVVTPVKGLNQMKITTKDSRHNNDYVKPPTGVVTDPDTDTEEREQALVMQYILTDWDDRGVEFAESLPGGGGVIVVYGQGNNIFDTEDANRNGVLDPGEDIGLGPGHLGAANGRLDEETAPSGYTRMVNTSALDFSRYRKLQVYIYAPPGSTAPSGNDVFFLRFGSDQSNYYEYVQQLQDLDRQWQLITVDLNYLLGLHAKGQPLIENDQPIVAGHYRIVGDPSLLNILEVSAGVLTKNPREGGSGGFVDWRELWVNNITLTEPEAQQGDAKRGKIALDFGDFIKTSAGYRNVSFGFESLGSTSTALTSTTSRDASATLELAKFMPDQWNVRMPLSGGVSKSETITEDKYDPAKSIYSQGKTDAISRNIGISFDRYKLPSWDLKFRNSDSINRKYARISSSDTYSASTDYEIFPRRRWLPVSIHSAFDRRYDDTVYGTRGEENEGYSWITDNNRNSVKFEPLADLEITPTYDFGYSRDRQDRTEEEFDESYGLNIDYFRVKGLRPNASYNSAYRETPQANLGLGPGGPGGMLYGLGPIMGKGETLDVSLSSDARADIPIEIGKLANDRAVGINKWVTTPGYQLTRSSSYQYLGARAPFSYRIGRDYLMPGIDPLSGEGGFLSSRIRHSITWNNRFNPLEFLGARKGTTWENWDFIQADVDLGYSNELSNSTGTPSRTIIHTLPDVSVQLYGTKNFPLVADYLDRSTVTLTYNRRRTYQQQESIEVKHQPGISWRATWTRTFRTKADYYYARTLADELDPAETGDVILPGTHAVLREANPALTLYYDLAMPKGFRIPLLGTIRWRNELNLTAGVSMTRIRGNENSTEDDSDQMEYTLSAGYYITTNLHADVTGSLTQYTNLSEVGRDYNTVGVTGNFEIIF